MIEGLKTSLFRGLATVTLAASIHGAPQPVYAEAIPGPIIYEVKQEGQEISPPRLVDQLADPIEDIAEQIDAETPVVDDYHKPEWMSWDHYLQNKEVVDTITSEFQAIGADTEQATKVANCESELNPAARGRLNPNVIGVFQVDARVHRFDLSDNSPLFDPRANVRAAVGIYLDSAGRFPGNPRGGWMPWKACLR